MDVDGNVTLQTACQQVDQFGGGSVLVSTGIHNGGRTALVHVADGMFQDDNAKACCTC